MFEGSGKWVDREREKGIGKGSVGRRDEGSDCRLDPGTPSVSEHSPPQALHFNTTDTRTAPG